MRFFDALIPNFTIRVILNAVNIAKIVQYIKNSKDIET